MQTISATTRFSIYGIVLTALACAGCDSQPTPSALPTGDSPGNVTRGKNLMSQYQCGSCHAIPGVPVARDKVGPPLDDFGRRSYIAGHIPNSAELLAHWIMAPRSLVPNTTMPSMGVTPDDARDIAAYLHTLR